MYNILSKYISAICIFVAAATLCTAEPTTWHAGPKQSIPSRDQVGALALPDEIAPVKAPFPMPDFKKPTFPNRTEKLSITNTKPGALSTKIIQAAIDEISAQGGGTVVIPKGIWKTGRISLKSNVNLHVAEGAELHFSGEIEDYLPVVFTRNEGIEVMSLGALIYAYNQNNIAITGKGKLIGPPRDCQIQKQMSRSGVIENVVPWQKPTAERIYDGKDGGEIFLPMFISPTACTNVYIEGITLEQTPFWNVVPVYCDGVIIRGITVRSVGIPRGDGIDVESSRNVLIEYSTLSCGDDCFTMKSGRAEDGVRVNKPTENVVVRFCLAEKGHGAITCGSETAGMIRNLYVHDCVFDGTGSGIRFKTRRNRGGGGENIYFERIRMDLSGTAFVWDLLGSRTYVGDLANRLPILPITWLTPQYRNIFANNLIVSRTTEFIKVTGIPETPLTNVVIENSTINNARALIRMNDVKDITLRNVHVTSQQNTISVLDGRNIIFENVTFGVPDDVITANITGETSANIRFINCTPQKPKNWTQTEWLPALTNAK